MSATNRGGQRREADFYETPEWVTETLLDRLEARRMLSPYAWDRVLEPAAGNGAIIRVMRRRRIIKHLTAVELIPSRALHLKLYVRPNRLYPGDFRSFANIQEKRHAKMLQERDEAGAPDDDVGYTLIMTNPPFSMAEAYVRRNLSLLAPGGHLALLLRLAFLEGKERLRMHNQFPSDVFILPRRPSFTGDGNSDMAAYAWFVWGPDCGNRWEHLNLPEPVSRRRRAAA